MFFTFIFNCLFRFIAFLLNFIAIFIVMFRFLLLLFCFFGLTKSVEAQIEYIYSSTVEEEKEHDNFGFVLGGGFNNAHTDFQTTKSIPSYLINAGLNFKTNDYFILNLDACYGVFKGNSAKDQLGFEPSFENKFVAATFTFRFLPFALVPERDRKKGFLKFMSHFYFGFGTGFLKSNASSAAIPVKDYGSLEVYKGIDFFIPFEGGYYARLATVGRSGAFYLNFNLRTNLGFTDRLDAYVPTVEANNYNDAFSSLSVGIVYRFFAN